MIVDSSYESLFEFDKAIKKRLRNILTSEFAKSGGEFLLHQRQLVIAILRVPYYHCRAVVLGSSTEPLASLSGLEMVPVGADTASTFAISIDSTKTNIM